jgi:hypothetical protein
MSPFGIQGIRRSRIHCNRFLHWCGVIAILYTVGLSHRWDTNTRRHALVRWSVSSVGPSLRFGPQYLPGFGAACTGVLPGQHQPDGYLSTSGPLLQPVSKP